MTSLEPHPKKRRSKWDVVATETKTTTTDAAAVAAAKINAMLAAQGKLAKSDNVILPPTTPTPTLGITTLPTYTTTKTTLLTLPRNATPLYSTPPSSGHQYIQDKVFIGLEEASSSFDVTDRLKGPDNSYMNHISAQTGAKICLRGKGSKFIEPTSGKESFEALHIFVSHTSQEGVNNARKLCQSLIDTVKKDYEQFKSAQAGPLGFGGGYNSNSSRPAVNPYLLHPPGYYGYSATPPCHPSYYGAPPQGPSRYNYPPPPGSTPYPLPSGSVDHFGPPHPPPPLHVSHSHTLDVRSEPPNAFTDYRTYDKVSVTSTEDPGKRKFTEEIESGNTGTSLRSFTNSSPVTQEPSTKSSKRLFTESQPTDCVSSDLGTKRKFDEDGWPHKRKFAESLAEPTLLEDSPQPIKTPVAAELVGKWQKLSQSTLVNPVSVPTSNVSSSPDEPPSGQGKDLMPPPSLPGGLKGMKFKKPQVISQPQPSASGPSNGKKEGSESQGPGLSLLAHYGDDSDSDNDG